MGKGGKGAEKKTEKVSLKTGLIERNALTPAFRSVLREVFNRFDLNQDKALCRDELEGFAKATQSGSEIGKDELKQLGQFFDTNTKGNLTLKGFEQMYLMQTNQQPEDTWRDLKNLGYSKSLELLGNRGTAGTGTGGTAVDMDTTTKAAMDEMRAALGELKLAPDSAGAHRRVAAALDALGRPEAAAKERRTADELEQKAAESTVAEQD